MNMCEMNFRVCGCQSVSSKGGATRCRWLVVYVGGWLSAESAQGHRSKQGGKAGTLYSCIVTRSKNPILSVAFTIHLTPVRLHGGILLRCRAPGAKVRRDWVHYMYIMVHACVRNMSAFNFAHSHNTPHTAPTIIHIHIFNRSNEPSTLSIPPTRLSISLPDAFTELQPHGAHKTHSSILRKQEARAIPTA